VAQSFNECLFSTQFEFVCPRTFEKPRFFKKYVVAGILYQHRLLFYDFEMMLAYKLYFQTLIYKQTKNWNETGSNLSLGTRLTVLSKRLGRKRCCDATPDRCLGGVPSHYLRFAL